MNQGARNHRAEWWASYRHTRKHITRHGYPTQRTIAPDGTRPGKWLAKQKERWETLAPEQQEALLELPGFALDARKAHFEKMSDACRRASTAGVNIFNKTATFEGLPVGQWYHDFMRGRTRWTPDRKGR